MTSEQRFCTNCRVELPPKADFCESCGAYAGDVFDGRTPQKRRAIRRLIVLLAILVVVAGAAAWIAIHGLPSLPSAKQKTPRVNATSTAVVRGRPGGTRRGSGAAISEPEAVRILRASITAAHQPPVSSECLALMSHGFGDGAYVLSAFDRCNGTRLGRWRVDGQTRAVTPAR